MADETTTTETPAAPGPDETPPTPNTRQVVGVEPGASQPNAPADTAPPPPAPGTPQLDETTPGGRYVVNGVEVNAEGAPLPPPAPAPSQSSRRRGG